MTFEQEMLRRLEENGMFEEDSLVVLGIVKDIFKDVFTLDRWNEDISGYPIGMTNTIWASVRNEAYKWLNENKPNAWFKLVFAPKEVQEKAGII